jgi:hypothetical protein
MQKILQGYNQNHCIVLNRVSWNKHIDIETQGQAKEKAVKKPPAFFLLIW